MELSRQAVRVLSTHSMMEPAVSPLTYKVLLAVVEEHHANLSSVVLVHHPSASGDAVLEGQT